MFLWTGFSSGAYLRQENKKGLKVRKLNLGQVLSQDRVIEEHPVLLESLTQDLFLYFNPVLPPCLKNGSIKSLFRETCLDLEVRNKKPVRQPDFFVDRLPSPDCRADRRDCSR